MEGGFLGALAGMLGRTALAAAPTLLKSLGIGALTGLASTGVSSMLGDGLYLKKGGSLCEVETDGRGLYLYPAAHSNEFSSRGDGLYIKKGSSIQSGNGLILGPNSPFNDIPLLGAIL